MTRASASRPSTSRSSSSPSARPTAPPIESSAAPGSASRSRVSWRRLLGGNIKVESTPGEGSVFRLVLPRSLPETAAARDDLAEPARGANLAACSQWPGLAAADAPRDAAGAAARRSRIDQGRRARAAGDRGRRAVRARALRPRARARLRLPARHDRRRGHGAGHAVPPGRRGARRQTTRSLGPHRAGPPEAQSADAPRAGAGDLGDGLRARRARDGRRRRAGETGGPRGTARRAAGAQGEVRQRATLACWWSRTTSCSARASCQLLASDNTRVVAADNAASALEQLRSYHLRLHGARPLAARCLGPRTAGTHGGRRCLCLPAGDRLHRAADLRRRGAAAAQVFALHHHQGRQVSGAAARRGDAVPAPGRRTTSPRPPAHAGGSPAHAMPPSKAGASWWSKTTCATSSRCRPCSSRSAATS